VARRLPNGGQPPKKTGGATTTLWRYPGRYALGRARREVRFRGLWARPGSRHVATRLAVQLPRQTERPLMPAVPGVRDWFPAPAPRGARSSNSLPWDGKRTWIRHRPRTHLGRAPAARGPPPPAGVLLHRGDESRWQVTCGSTSAQSRVNARFHVKREQPAALGRQVAWEPSGPVTPLQREQPVRPAIRAVRIVGPRSRTSEASAADLSPHSAGEGRRVGFDNHAGR
jgi:hypothetical protein